jgi:hypothetical protein
VATFAATAATTSVRALINWGDGTTSVGSVVVAGGQVRVSGNHVYRRAGTFRVLVTAETGAGQIIQAQAKARATSVKRPPAGPRVMRLRAVPVTGTTTATVRQTIGQFNVAGKRRSAGAFRVLIDWGDMQATSGKLKAKGNGFIILGSHTYLRPGTYPIEITVMTKEGSATRTQGSARIAAS